MSEISSDNLHHFTHSFEACRSILLEGFYPHIIEEDISFILKNILSAKAGFPIVCFCDLPTNLLEMHRKKYGNYGLSLSKEWGIKKGINPVMYVSDKNTQVMNYYRKMQQVVLNKEATEFIDTHKDADGKEKMKDYFFNVLCMSAFFRKYENETTRFYDEREWRYLFIDNQIQVYEQIYLTDLKNFDLEKRNQELQKHPLSFEFEDIRNIFVKTKKEKISLIENICKNVKYSGRNDDLNKIIIVEE